MKSRDIGRHVLIPALLVVIAAMQGCASVSQSDGPAAPGRVSGKSHVAASALSKAPRMAEGAESLTLSGAKKRATFDLRLPDAALVAGDNRVARVLAQGSDAGEGFYIQYRKYEIAQMPTDIPFNQTEYTEQQFMRDLSDPSSSFARYRDVRVGPYAGVMGAEFTQVEGDQLIAYVPAIVTWQVPAPAGSGAEYLNLTLIAWDMKERSLLRIAESLNR